MLCCRTYGSYYGGSISYWLPRSRIFLPHITRTPAMYSRIFRSHILHVSVPHSRVLSTPYNFIRNDQYYLRKFCFTVRIVVIWNSLPSTVVNVDSVDLSKSRLDRLWKHQNVRYGYKAELPGMRNQPQSLNER